MSITIITLRIIKLFISLLVIFLSGCAIESKVSSSYASIDGWYHNKGVFTDRVVEVRFIVNNSSYVNVKERFILEYDRGLVNGLNGDSFGDNMSIDLVVKSVAASVEFDIDGVLLYKGNKYKSIGAIIGRYAKLDGCRYNDSPALLGNDVELSNSFFTCIRYIFPIDIIPASEQFSMFVKYRSNFFEEVFEARFSERTSSYIGRH